MIASQGRAKWSDATTACSGKWRGRAKAAACGGRRKPLASLNGSPIGRPRMAGRDAANSSQPAQLMILCPAAAAVIGASPPAEFSRWTEATSRQSGGLKLVFAPVTRLRRNPSPARAPSGARVTRPIPAPRGWRWRKEPKIEINPGRRAIMHADLGVAAAKRDNCATFSWEGHPPAQNACLNS
jgi:hypothetical protein